MPGNAPIENWFLVNCGGTARREGCRPVPHSVRMPLRPSEWATDLDTAWTLTVTGRYTCT